jgi:two-component system, sensor histidine kinase
MINFILRFWNRSIRRQLIVGITFIILVSLFWMSYNILNKESIYIHDAAENHAQNRMNILANNSAVWVMANDYIGLQEVIDSVRLYDDQLYAMAVDPHGKVLAHTDKSKVGLYLVDSLSVEHLKSQTDTYTILSHDASHSDHFIEVASPILYKNQLLGYVRGRINHDSWTHALQMIKQEIYLSALLAMILAMIFAYLSASTLTRSLYNLIEVTRKVRRGERHVRADEGGVEEILTLAHEFNTMLDVQERNENEIRKAKQELEADIVQRIEAERTISELNRNLETTVKERTKELIVEKDKAESANRAKSVFLANMSHELRTPLNAILGFSQMLSNDKKITPEQKERLDIINYSGEHLLKLINDILDMSKIEAGKMEIEESPFDLLAMIREISEMMKYKAHQKKLRFLLDTHSDFLRYVRSDASKIRQILINLLSNAIKYTDSGGVSLRLRSFPIEGTKRYSVTFEIEDSGRGMSQEELQTVFEPFVQVQSAKGISEGTGLGLSITYKFLELLGAKIEVKSEVGVGTIFTFVIDLEAVNAEEIASTQKSTRIIGIARSPKKYSVLIVEDQKENMLLLKNILLDVGFEVHQATNGVEAIEKFREFGADLIWMDMRMPVMDGYEATRNIRSIESGKEVPIIALTASAFKDQLHEIMNVGCDALVHKPYRQSEIFETMKRYLDIDYIYEKVDEGEPLDYNSDDLLRIATLPKEIISELHKALIELDSTKIGEVIEKIGMDDGELASQMMSLVQNYQYDRILEIVEGGDPDERE